MEAMRRSARLDRLAALVAEAGSGLVHGAADAAGDAVADRLGGTNRRLAGATGAAIIRFDDRGVSVLMAVVMAVLMIVPVAMLRLHRGTRRRRQQAQQP